MHRFRVITIITFAAASFLTASSFWCAQAQQNQTFESDDSRPPRNSSKRKPLHDVAKIVALIIAASRAAYYARGRPCACPDDTMRNGRLCGRRSAYSRAGGARPLCSPADVTPAMIERFVKTGSPQIPGR